MKADLDRLMEARKLDAFVVICGEQYCAERDYMTNGVAITGGYVMKKCGAPPVIFCNPMEIAEAQKSGLECLTYDQLGWSALIEEFEGDRTKATIVLFGRCLEHLGIRSGRVGLYGEVPANMIIELVRLLSEAYPRITFAGEMGMTLFDEAYVTKDADELARLRSVAARTSRVLQQTWDFIASHRADGNTVVNEAGIPLTIGAVKQFVRRALLDLELEDTHMIFAQGRDGGFPHSRGEDDDVLRTGQAIVFDLFPRELGGGYFHDCTRTWSIGFATDEVESAYRQVMDAFEVAIDSFRPGMPAKAMQEQVQAYFEAAGHPTTRSQPGTTVGYVHSLGHGIGLNIHERPSLSHLSKDTLQPGNLLTIEPGLYYPEKGFGVRIEDSVYVREDGQLETLTDFHKELVLPLRGAAR
ncbi:aminopeptidase P family protein [Anaerolineae bacterium CFX9]|nr:aminopeptidase P family protein [Anaerolineae bacterium CFX9]